MGKFKLVNPVIIGTFNDTYETSSVDAAAQKFWETLTSDNKYVSGTIPKFLFSLMDTSDKELYHYMVKEKQDGSRSDYSITPVKVNIPKETKTSFLKEVQKVKNNSQDGGAHDDSEKEKTKKHRKRYEDDSSSSDSDDDVDDFFRYVRRKRAKKPIVYWWYTPAIYNVNTIFTPTFVAPVSPYVQLWMPM